MARRPLIATVVTTVIGAVFGTGLGALVGRVIALVGDETVQTSVPVVFCGTLGFFVGGASAAKGSLDRFGARRSGMGAFVATVLLVLIVGGASLGRSAGATVAVLGVVAAVLAGAAASLVGAPQAEPVVRGQRPRQVVGPTPKPVEAAPQEQIEAEFIATPKPAIRKVPVAVEPVRAPEPEPAAEPAPAPEPASTRVLEEQANWTLDESPRPRRDRPLSRADVAAEAARAAKAAAPKTPAKKAVANKAAVKKAPDTATPPSPRPRRDRPLRRGDA